MKMYYFKKFCKTATELSDKRKRQLITAVCKSLEDNVTQQENNEINNYIKTEKYGKTRI
tara:strand:+ start:262 stop:438 length:177 start_codon:yes stop_codon:yes gene_type:complete